MNLKCEGIIDGLSGLTREFTTELNKLNSELFDKLGNPIMPDTEEDLNASIEKGNRYCHLISVRNDHWAAKLN